MRTTSTAVILVLATPPKQKAAGTSNRSKYWLHQIQPYFGTAAGQDLIQLALYPKTPISDLPQGELHWLHTDVSKYDAGGLAEILAKFNPQALFLSGCPNFTHLEAGWNAKIPLVFWQKENGKQPANLCFIQNFYRSLGQNQPIGAAFTEANMQASIKDGKKFEKARIYDDMGKIPKEPFPGGGLLIGSKGRKLMDQTFFPADYVAEKTSPTRELRPPRTKLHSDHWSQEDFLGYELYANVITQLINDQESIPPLTEQLFKPPNYESKLGLFHEINSDLDRVMDLLVSPDLPLVIFIDDLDRCAHSRVVEVIEAINLMMNGRFRDRCYFILGMDAEVVAAALDVAYKDVHGKLSDRERQLGSVGWYFLDKFIQLPFVIPTLNQEDKEEYLSQLFDAPVPSPEVDTIESYDPEQILSAAENLWKNYNTENTEKISTIRGR